MVLSPDRMGDLDLALDPHPAPDSHLDLTDDNDDVVTDDNDDDDDCDGGGRRADVRIDVATSTEKQVSVSARTSTSVRSMLSDTNPETSESPTL